MVYFYILKICSLSTVLLLAASSNSFNCSLFSITSTFNKLAALKYFHIKGSVFLLGKYSKFEIVIEDK